MQPDHETAVPKFGDWDESDPKSADGFTHVFNKVREEKLNGQANVAPVKAFQNSYPKAQKQHENEMSKVPSFHSFMISYDKISISKMAPVRFTWHD